MNIAISKPVENDLAVLERARKISDRYESRPRLDAIRELSLRIAQLESQVFPSQGDDLSGGLSS